MPNRVLRVVALLSLATAARGQTPAPVPFVAGERLMFTVRGPGGASGRAVMSVTGPIDVGGTPTVLAVFSTRVRVALMRGFTEGKSWIDPVRMASLRYVELERRPFKTTRDSVEIDPMRMHWARSARDTGSTATNRPLDEVSFIYFLRTVTLAPDSLVSFDRFYDQQRLPTTVRVVKRDTLSTSKGMVSVVELEMHVKDVPGRAIKVIRIWLSADACHLPMRIESSFPPFGKGTLTLDSAVTPGCGAGLPVVASKR